MAEQEKEKDIEFDFEQFSPGENDEGEADIFSSARDSFLDELGEAGLTLEIAPNQRRARGDSRPVAIIRTSDRIMFKRCRRMWNWAYSRRGNLRSNKESLPLWFGTGMHFVLEDFHGRKLFERPRYALEAFYQASLKTGVPLPDDVEEALEMGFKMMDYYESWLINREPLNTFWYNKEPQVEVNFHVEIPKEHLSQYTSLSVLDRYSKILYSVTLDRVIQDEYNRLWTVEYKSAKAFLWSHLDTDPQISAYAWGASVKYPNHEVAGTIYQQHKKQVLAPPKFIKSIGMYSVSKQQKTTHALYRQALTEMYGPEQNRWPEPNRAYLNYILARESQNADELVKRDYVERSKAQQQAEYQKILMEASELLNPDILIYPNPSRDCSWCAFQAPCVGIDQGEDWTQEIKNHTIQRDTRSTNWRTYLVEPDDSSNSLSTRY